jgi:hypothetical protein
LTIFQETVVSISYPSYFAEYCWRAVIALGLAVSLVACAGAPVQEMSDGRQAITAAEQAGATQTAPAELDAAKRWMVAARRALRQGRYGQARTYAGHARRTALQALGTIEATRDASRRRTNIPELSWHP